MKVAVMTPCTIRPWLSVKVVILTLSKHYLCWFTR